ncbi:MAG: DUF1844 domain-containing protein [Blastocatellia bacterium]
MSEEQEVGFKVSDRRKFNPDGTPRDLYEEEPPAPAAPAAPVAPPPPAPTVRPEEIYSTAAQPALEPAPPPFADAAEPLEEEPEMTEFMQIIYSLATSTAFIHLGLMEHPATGRPEVNLQAAQQGIGMLMILREKTKGNLTSGEEEFFDTLLSDLKMQFVSLRRG